MVSHAARSGATAKVKDQGPLVRMNEEMEASRGQEDLRPGGWASRVGGARQGPRCYQCPPTSGQVNRVSC